MSYSEAQGTLIYEKNLKSKISCQTPFKSHQFLNLQDYYTNELHETTIYKYRWLYLRQCKERVFSVVVYCTLPTTRGAEFVDEIQAKVLRVFLLAIHSHFYSFALSFLFLQIYATSYSFYSSVTVHCTGERRKT
jgi:hypothetical protein